MLGEKPSPAKSGRAISTTLLPHLIPPHVDAALSRPTFEEGCEQDRRRLWNRLRYEVAASLVLRGYTAEEFCWVMPGHTPAPEYVRFSCKEPRAFPRHNVMWEEITHRGVRELPASRYEPMVLKAFKYAEERIGEGMIPDVDQPAYGEALIRRWTWGVERGWVVLSAVEAGVLAYVCDQMRSRGFVDVTCPAREVAKPLGVDRMVAWRALKKLARDGVLICRSSGDAKGRMAAVYCLSFQLPGGPDGPQSAWRRNHEIHFHGTAREPIPGVSPGQALVFRRPEEPHGV